ncbi:MAG: carboxypeptidase-like regulatory domain-containing protein, partial [archaeon]
MFLLDLEFLQPLADFYFSLEDKWYDFWEKAGEKFPSLGLMDKIEKIDNFFPSLQLFLIVLFLLLAGIIGLFFSFGPYPPLAAFKVIDTDSVVLAGVFVTITDGSQDKNFTSDLFGEFRAQLNSKTVKVAADLNGYIPFFSEMAVQAGENRIVLEKQGVEFDKKLVTIVDEKNLVLKQPVTASFSCSGQSAPPSPVTKNSGGEFEVPFLKDCGALTAQIDSAGYNSVSKVLESYRTTIQLLPENIPTGEIAVSVRDLATNALLSNISVTLFKASIFVKTNEGRTDASGSYSFHAAPGTYYASAKDQVLEKYVSNQSGNFEVVAGETKNVQILLAKNLGAKTRLFLKFSDTDSKETIFGVKADLFDGNLFEDSATSQQDGTVSFRNLSEDKNYAVVVAHKDFVTKIIDSPALVEDDETQATEVLLSKADSGNSGTVRVMVLSVEPAKNAGIALADVALYNLGHNFPILTGKTDSNGNAVFSNMPPDSYHARAENATQSGVSTTKTLSNGSEIVLQINFVLKKSFLRVKTVNEKGENLSGTNLKFFDSTTMSLLKEASTVAGGQSEKLEFPWNAKFFISASAPGYLTYNTKIFS